ncbi:MAG: hypothetical protein GF400_00255 [Candidatus Eisenbacteria bacterium]|nr:hypothetical protein [Candidatus Eisenbacteria bacterium]
MKLGLALTTGMLLVLLPSVALGQVIDISEVNADDENGYPVLFEQVVTVRGVVTIGTGYLASNNDVYIQDATGGVNVVQPLTASPAVARGDSVMVTGEVLYDLSSGSLRKTYIEVDTSQVPEAGIAVLSTGHAPPAPAVVTPRMLATSEGEDYEGTYAVMRRVYLTLPHQWPDEPCAVDQATYVADADTSCRLWFDADTDVCGSPAPGDTFDVYGVVVPRLRTVSSWRGHGMLPPSREHVLSRGPGSGFAEAETERVFANQTVDLAFSLRGEADVLTRIVVEIPEGWNFSGQASDVALSGAGFTGAAVVEDSTTADLVTVSGAALTVDDIGTLEIENIVAPDAAGGFTFVFATAPAAGEPAAIQESPEVVVGFLADPGAVLITEVYAHSLEDQDAKDRAEFIELANPGDDTVDVSGWALADLDDSGACGGSNIWEFPTDPPVRLAPGERLVVTKDAYKEAGPRSYGFLKVFGDSLDVNAIKLFEMVDSDFDDSDWQGDATWDDVPNMVLVSDSDGDVTTSQEIRLLGGFDRNGALSPALLPGAEAVYLYSDRTLTQLVDAMEYRDPVHFQSDHCPGTEGLGGASDAYPGVPPEHYSLVRDLTEDDTDDSAHDFVLSSWPTPGTANVLGDGKAPEIVTVGTGGSTFVLVEFNEPVDEDDAVDEANYEITAQEGLAERLTVGGAWLTRDARTVLLKTGEQTPDQVYDISVTGVSDAGGNLIDPHDGTFSGSPSVVTPLSEIQDWDENGYSPLWGQEATTVGFAVVEPGVFQPDRTNIFIEDTEGWGLNVYSPELMPHPAMVGDLLLCSGLVVEYRSVDSSDPWATPEGSTTEISNALITVLARGFDAIEPSVLRTGDVGSERLEGTLARTSGVVVSVEGFAIYIDDGSGACQVYQNFTDLDFSQYALGDSLDVTGIVLQYDYTEPYLDGYELAPRYDSDIVKLGSAGEGTARLDVDAKVLDISSGESIDIGFFSNGCSHVAVRIYDLKGRAVATVYDGKCMGDIRRSWDGRDDNGKKVPVGVYICHIQADARDGEKITDSAVPIVVGTKLN